jgi:acetyltransferase
VFDAAFARAGLIRVRNMIELLAVSEAFKHYRSIGGPRVGVVTATGACGIMTADACEDYGMELAPFPRAIADGLENERIAWHKLRNPVDLWPLGMVTGSFMNLFKQAVRGLLEDERVDAVLGIAPALSSELHSDLDMSAAVREANATNTSHKPIAMWLYGGDQDRQAELLSNEPDVACFSTIDEAIMGLAALWRYQRFQQQAKSVPGFPDFLDKRAGADRAVSRPFPLPPEPVLVGESAFELLRPYGIPLISGKLAVDVESALSFGLEAGYPLVLKIISPQWLHKSDRGGIRLDIANESELRSGYTELTDLFRRETPKGTLDGILVQKQVKGVELLLGIKRDPEFGPVLVAGMGGIYTEVFKDVARTLVPLDSGEAEKLLRSLRIYPILKGARGQSGVDLDELIAAMVSLSRLAVDYPEISELDLNPVLANSDGCWCVDSRIVLG